jgi:hypothetical protein
MQRSLSSIASGRVLARVMGGLGCLLAAGSFGCSPADTVIEYQYTYVRVRVSGWPSGTARLSFRSSIDSTLGSATFQEAVFDVPAGATPPFVAGLKLPPGSTGTFKVDVALLDGGGNVIGECSRKWAGTASGPLASMDGSTLDVALSIPPKPSMSGVTQDLYAVWGSGSQDIWAVGAGGMVAHYDGCSWVASLVPGTTQPLRAIWGSSATDIWAVGGTSTMDTSQVAVAHYDGKSWSGANIPTIRGQLNGVWGTGSGNVYAVGGDSGTNGLVLNNTGGGLTSWTPVLITDGLNSTAYWNGIHGTTGPASRIVLVGKSQNCTAAPCAGMAAVYDGVAWQRPKLGSGVQLELTRVLLLSKATVLLGGTLEWLAVWDGSSQDPSPILRGTVPNAGPVMGLSPFVDGSYAMLVQSTPTTAPGRVFKGPASLTAGSLTQVNPVTGNNIDTYANGLYAANPSDIWVVGPAGARFHYDGAVIDKYVNPN